MADFEVLVPDGYEIVETDKIVDSDRNHVHLHVFRKAAEVHASDLNDGRVAPSLRWVVEPTTKAMKKKWGRWARWAVVPYQNVLQLKKNVVLAPWLTPEGLYKQDKLKQDTERDPTTTAQFNRVNNNRITHK